MKIGKNIYRLRAERSMTQETLAGLLSVSRELVVKWENGTRRPDYSAIERIAAVFGVAPDEIFDRNDYIFSELSECVPDEVDISDEDLLVCLDGFLRGLRTNDADIFILRYTHLESNVEIAWRFGLKENHVRSILSKTRRKLRAYLREVGK